MQYFHEMYQAVNIRKGDCESLAMMFLSMNFGFVFLNASFGEKLTKLDKDEYIRNSIQVFLQGIC